MFERHLSMASGCTVRHLADVPAGRGASKHSIDFNFDQMIKIDEAAEFDDRVGRLDCGE
jgi:hypothetical protein